MQAFLKRGGLFAWGLAVTLLVGCGGGGGSGNSGSRGNLTLVLTFPALPAAARAPQARGVTARHGAGRGSGCQNCTSTYSNGIPLGAQSALIALTDPTTGTPITAPKLAIAPQITNSTGPGLPANVTVEFPGLPAGPVQVTISAFPNAGGSGNALATGSNSGTIAAAGTTTINVLLNLTLTQVTADQTQLTLTSGSTGMVHIKALDSSNRSLQDPLTFSSSDSTVATVSNLSYDSVNGYTATIQAQPGLTTVSMAMITFCEANSGLAQCVMVTVTP